MRDVCGIDRTPICSTLGVRAATRSEIRKAKKEELDGYTRIPFCEYHADIEAGTC